MLRKERILLAVNTELNPLFLEVLDESSNHHVPAGAETHFKLIIVSNKFKDLKIIARHRLINHLLTDEFDKGLHALSLHLYTPDEWQETGAKTTDSPACRDGFNKS